jgi:tetratricopeptide (TPR) repeat protein
MRQHVQRGIWVALVLLAVCWIAGAGYAAEPLIIDADAQLEYARALLGQGKHDAAVIEFQRFIHFFPDDPRLPAARFDMAMAHFDAGRTDAAEAEFLQLTDTYTGDALQTEAFFMLSRCHARQGKRVQSILDLHNLMALSDDVNTDDRARYEIGWRHVDQAEWQQAATVFGTLSEANRARLHIGDLLSTLSTSDTLARRDPTTAGILSVVPGGGQLYCNRYQDALAAFLINTGLIWASWESFDNDQPALGGVLAFVGFGFYAGNIYGAMSSAHTFNRDRAGEFRDRLYRRKQAWLSLAPHPGGAGIYLSVAF